MTRISVEKGRGFPFRGNKGSEFRHGILRDNYTESPAIAWLRGHGCGNNDTEFLGDNGIPLMTNDTEFRGRTEFRE